jgi:DNA polymerase-3 subunit alpha
MFLSPERLSFPDVDSDVPRDKRADAIQYLLDKYGKDKVSQIVTFG